MIQVQNLSKTFYVARRDAGLKQAARSFFYREKEAVRALDQVSFTIDEGEMVGYIGPNGAGKSSTIKVMSGILTPDSGSCVINGLTPWKSRKAHVRQIGVVFGQRSQLWWDVPVIDSFELLRDIYRVPEDAYHKNLSELTEMLSLQEFLKTPARQLSLGQRMRCEIAASLLHQPKVLFLDEPTIGLDAVSKLAVRDFVRQLNQQNGTTVILTTHDMQDIEALTHRIILIGKGRILLDGSMDALKQELSPVRTVTVACQGNIGALQLPDGVQWKEKTAEHTEGIRHLTLRVDTGKTPVPVLIAKLSEQVSLYDLSVESISMDELVLSLYRKYRI